MTLGNPNNKTAIGVQITNWQISPDADAVTVEIELRGTIHDGDQIVTISPPQRRTVELSLTDGIEPFATVVGNPRSSTDPRQRKRV